MEKASTLVELDLRSVLSAVQRRYRLRLPARVVMVDYDPEVGSLYLRFHEDEQVDGEPSADGNLLRHYNRRGRLVAIEVLNIARL